MLVALWIINGLLALAFVAAGTLKVVRPKAALAGAGLAWVEDFSAPAVKGIAVLDILGGLGLVLPLATGIAPVLAPIAAIGLALLMAGAVATHVRRKESAAPSIVLGILSIASAVLGFATVL